MSANNLVRARLSAGGSGRARRESVIIQPMMGVLRAGCGIRKCTAYGRAAMRAKVSIDECRFAMRKARDEGGGRVDEEGRERDMNDS